MATLNLSRVWINLMSSGEAVSAFSADRSRQVAAPGEVRTYGGGRRRSVSQAGTADSIAFTLRRVSTAQRERLTEWIGEQVMYRDYRGQRLVGTFYDLAIKEYKAEPDLYDVSTTLHGVTWVEGA